MKPVSIVTSSTACIPARFAKEYDIGIVPFMLIIGDKSYRDDIDITTEKFYEALEEDHSRISTSAPSIGSLLEIFEKKLEGSEQVLCITIASGMSGEFNAASSAVEKMGTDRVTLFDSRTAATGQAQIVLEAARAARRGENLETVLGAAEEIAEKIKVYGVIESLEYLKRSGRVSAISALAADTLNIKPIFQFTDGEAKPVAKPRSKRKALERVVREAVETFQENGPLNLAVFHVLAEDEARFLDEKIRTETECESSFIAHFTPVMGKHTGPGLVGASFY
ncbi:MAG: DegV family protein [Actinobacteria bacterium]|nr:DegV family protein [Actinomycetota bacterium]